MNSFVNYYIMTNSFIDYLNIIANSFAGYPMIIV